MHQQQSDFLILVLYDFIVQNILSSGQKKKYVCLRSPDLP
jgi:hypothetical protein